MFEDAGLKLVFVLIICHCQVVRLKANYSNTKTVYADVEFGRDELDGSSDHVNSTTGPVKSISRAFDILRANRKQNPTCKLSLVLSPGTYMIRRPIDMDHKLSDISITTAKRGNDDSKALFTSAIEIPLSKFLSLPTNVFEERHNRDKSTHRMRVILNIPPAYRSKILYVKLNRCSRHVFLDNYRLIPARSPNIHQWNGTGILADKPYYRIKNILKKSPFCLRKGKTNFTQVCSDINKRGFKIGKNILLGDILREPLYNPSNSDMVVFHSWTAERVAIASLNENEVIFKKELRTPIGSNPVASGWRYILEHALEALDSPGEFYCDSTNNILFLIPPEKVSENPTVWVGNSPFIMKINNTQNINISNIEFRHTTHLPSNEGYGGSPALIDVTHSNNIQIMNNSFRGIGFNAINLNGVQNAVIGYNDFKDIGNYGIRTSNEEGSPYGDPWNTLNITIHNNTFYGCGTYHLMQPSCVHVRGVRNIKVLGNQIELTPYAGIKFGWQVGFTRNYTSSAIALNGVPEKYVFFIEENNVKNFGMGVLNDFGGIYASTNMTLCGNRYSDSHCHLHALVSHNIVSNGSAYYYGGQGFYGDTASSSLTVSENWFYNLGQAAVRFNCGKNNKILNNVIIHTNRRGVFGACSKSVDSNKKRRPTQSFSAYRNIIIIMEQWANLYKAGDWWTREVPKFDDNIYVGPGLLQRHIGPDQFVARPFPKHLTFEEWQNQTQNDFYSTIHHLPSFRSPSDFDLTLVQDQVTDFLRIKPVDLMHVRKP